MSDPDDLQKIKAQLLDPLAAIPARPVLLAIIAELEALRPRVAELEKLMIADF